MNIIKYLEEKLFQIYLLFRIKWHMFRGHDHDLVFYRKNGEVRHIVWFSEPKVPHLVNYITE